MMTRDPFAQAWMAQSLQPAQPSPMIGASAKPLQQAFMGGPPSAAGPAPNPNDPTAPVAVTPQRGTPSDAEHPILGALRGMFNAAAAPQGGQPPQLGGQAGGLQFGGRGGNMDKVMGIMRAMGLGA